MATIIQGLQKIVKRIESKMSGLDQDIIAQAVMTAYVHCPDIFSKIKDAEDFSHKDGIFYAYWNYDRRTDIYQNNVRF